MFFQLAQFTAIAMIGLFIHTWISLDANTLPGAVCSPVDGMHMTKEAHRALAQGLYRELTASV